MWHCATLPAAYLNHSFAASVGKIALDRVPVLGGNPVGVRSRIADFTLHGDPGARRDAGTGAAHRRPAGGRGLHTLLTRAGWEGDSRVGAFEGGGIGFGCAAGRNVGLGRIFACAHFEIRGRRRALFSSRVSGFTSASAGALLGACRVSFALHATGVRSRLGRIPRSPAFARTGLVRLSKGGTPSALTRLSIRAFAAIFTRLSTTFVLRRISL